MKRFHKILIVLGFILIFSTLSCVILALIPGNNDSLLNEMMAKIKPENMGENFKEKLAEADFQDRREALEKAKFQVIDK